MKFFLLGLMLLFSKNALLQVVNASTNFGYAIGETKQFKKFMIYQDWSLGFERSIKERFFIGSNLTISSLRYDFIDTTNQHVFSSNYFIGLPVHIGKYLEWGESQVYGRIGVASSYYFSKKETLYNSDESLKRYSKNLGFNFALLTDFGIKKFLSRNFSISLGLGGQTDYFFMYKRKSDQVNLDKRYLTLTISKNFAP